jgi:hypothetical protein
MTLDTLTLFQPIRRSGCSSIVFCIAATSGGPSGLPDRILGGGVGRADNQRND